MFREQTASDRTKYVRDIFANEDNALKSIIDTLDEQEKIMQIGPDEGKILQVLAKMVNAKKIVEIGVLAGYSAIWMARSLPEGGKLYAFEKNKNLAERILKNFAAANISAGLRGGASLKREQEQECKIELIIGNALDNLPKIKDQGPFDMVFIDADKGGYPDYLDWAESNIRKGGIIVGDNTFLFGHVYKDQCPDNFSENSWNKMREFNQRLANTEKYTSIMLPTIEGMTVAVKL